MHRMNEKQNINFIFILSKEAIFVAKQSHERNTTSADVNALWNSCVVVAIHQKSVRI